MSGGNLTKMAAIRGKLSTKSPFFQQNERFVKKTLDYFSISITFAVILNLLTHKNKST